MKEIRAQQVTNYLDDYQLVDVREAAETANGMILEAMHIPLGELPEKLSSLSGDKPLLFVCRSGARSERAALYAEAHGFQTANMTGGMINYKGSMIQPAHN
ncbi:rhodanese-like domain-containing protein [Alkalicoccus luteus]|uniref:Rhodanese-like domain-containing protein n=1 Tax=Alkalicoccus luteus TaxID=1237094 RepID=A0A969TW09_9BACI|nr:rhodanese-like domain-containing protein [Alkalicoccus luteus]NJP38950.1 rhodanese-like domain-containing protein [Alkalicoccus luteus]